MSNNLEESKTQHVHMYHTYYHLAAYNIIMKQNTMHGYKYMLGTVYLHTHNTPS